MRTSFPSRLPVYAALILGAATGPSLGADCPKDVSDPALKRLNCHFEAVAEGDAANEVKEATAGLVESYDCKFDIDVALDKLDEGRAKSLAVPVPGQSFDCKIKTVAGELSPSGKVSATVTSEEGKVTDVKISVDDTKGLKGFVAKALKLVLGSKKVRRDAAEAVEKVLAERAAKR